MHHTRTEIVWGHELVNWNLRFLSRSGVQWSHWTKSPFRNVIISQLPSVLHCKNEAVLIPVNLLNFLSTSAGFLAWEHVTSAWSEGLWIRIRTTIRVQWLSEITVISRDFNFVITDIQKPPFSIPSEASTIGVSLSPNSKVSHSTVISFCLIAPWPDWRWIHTLRTQVNRGQSCNLIWRQGA